MSEPRALLSLDPAELRELVTAAGGRPFHARVVLDEVWRGVRDYDAMTSLPRGVRECLSVEAPIYVGTEIARSVASDGTIKWLVRYGDSDHVVETVWIPSRSKPGATLCVSTQVGCPVACPFCASGLLGLSRNLAAHEIVEQYLRGAELGELSRSVVMGIGEPLLNFQNLRSALEAVSSGLGLGARKITLSTVGFPDRLRRIAPTKPPFQLAISLHTPFDDERDELVPAMRGTPIEDVLSAGDDWFERTGREVTYEVVLLGGHNDTDAHAEALVERLLGRRCTVNLIPFNPVDESAFARPDAYAVSAFQRALTRVGLVTTVRWSRGLEADAACGQLRIRAR